MIEFNALAASTLGFAVALAWTEAASKTVASLLPAKGVGAAARVSLVYALIVSLVVVFFVAVINHTHRALRSFREPLAAPDEAPFSLAFGPASGHDFVRLEKI